jgi:hypothetical protein
MGDNPPPPLTDEERDWLEKQSETAEIDAQKSAAEQNPQQEPSQNQADYEETMKMIEENRLKNEAKRKAINARNKDIEDRFDRGSL